VRHHVAPVAGRVADREQDRLVLGPCPRERLVAPRVPLDGIRRVLQEVRARLAREPVHALYGNGVALPGGTVTFLFTDIEGSTRLLQELGDDYGQVVADHRRLLREVFGSAGGNEVDTQGDAFFYSFTRAKDAVRAAVAGQRALAGHEWPGGAQVRVRIGLHTGEPTVREEGYVGLDVVRAARICSAGHGGQILISETTRALLGNDLPDRVSVRDLGEQHLKDVQHEHVYELSLDESQAEFPPLKEARPDRGEDIAKRFEDKINRYVEDQLEAALSGAIGGRRPEKPHSAKRGCLLTLAAVGSAIAALVLGLQLLS
jgi:class 3 adenylate cyclase